MKTTAIALLMLVASATALSQVSTSDLKEQRRDIAEIIINAVEKLKEKIQDRGLDPYEIDWRDFDYVLISPSLLSVYAHIEDFSFSGLSNIDVKDIGFSLLSNKLTFDVELPRVLVTIGEAAAEVSVIGRDINGQVSGSFAVNGLGVEGEARVSLESNSRVSVSDVKINTRLGAIESDLNISILGLNLSSFVNTWLNNLPGNLSIYEDLINGGLEKIITFIINRLF